jgi:hypothetical protein
MASSKPFASSGNVGAAGELAFRVQTLLRGDEVFIPQVDSGVDLMVNGHRCQVKSSRWSDKHRRFGWSFHTRDGSKDWSKLAPDVDLVVLVGIDYERHFFFWIVPCEWLRRFPFQSQLSLGKTPGSQPTRRGTFSWIHDFRDAWHLLDPS